MASCCPPDSHGPFKNDAKPKGEMVTLFPKDAGSGLKELPCYKSVGTANNKPKTVVLVFCDVFGIDSGNHKIFCDALQESLGDNTEVWMPDYFRGKEIQKSTGIDFFDLEAGALLVALPGWLFAKCRISSDSIEKDLTEIVVPNAVEATGCESIGVAGFCFGGWVVARCLALGHNDNDGNSLFSCGVCFHPLWSLNENLWASKGETGVALAEKTGTKPILLLPSKGDNEMKVGQPIPKILAEKRSKSEEEITKVFEKMKHGFVSRGDPSDPDIRKDQQCAFDHAVKFFKQNLKLEN